MRCLFPLHLAHLATRRTKTRRSLKFEDQSTSVIRTAAKVHCIQPTTTKGFKARGNTARGAILRMCDPHADPWKGRDLSDKELQDVKARIAKVGCIRPNIGLTNQIRMILSKTSAMLADCKKCDRIERLGFAPRCCSSSHCDQFNVNRIALETPDRNIARNTCQLKVMGQYGYNRSNVDKISVKEWEKRRKRANQECEHHRRCSPTGSGHMIGSIWVASKVGLHIHV